MKPLYHAFIYLALFCLVAAGCTKKSKKMACGPCPMYALMLPNINFRVVDKTTGKDLFFGSTAPYKVGQLKMHHIINGIPDTAYVRIDSLNNNFNVFVNPMHAVDTVTMQIANLPQDILLFKTSIIGDCCAHLILSSVSYNGTTVFTAANGPNVVVLAK